MSDNKYYVNQQGQLIKETSDVSRREVVHSSEKSMDAATTFPKISPDPDTTPLLDLSDPDFESFFDELEILVLHEGTEH